MIEIRPSQRLRVVVLLIWAAGVSLLGLQSLQCGWCAQLLWTAAILYGACATHGLNNRRLVLRTQGAKPQVVVGGVSRPLSDVRVGITGPGLITALLVTPHERLAIVIASDNASREARWRLRRLLVDGLRAQPGIGDP